MDWLDPYRVLWHHDPLRLAVAAPAATEHSNTSSCDLPLSFYAKQGGLIAYGFDNIDLFRRAAPYVAWFSNGEDAGALLV